MSTNRTYKIAFIGGIHGVGKSTVCKSLCQELKMEYLLASELLKWKEINNDVKNKKVQDISETQERLISVLDKTIQNGGHYMLDGHYSLLDSNSEVTKVPLDTFKQIAPFSLNIILGETSEVKMRLEQRDKREYDYALLKHLQDVELNNAEYISRALNIPLNIGTLNDYSRLIDMNRVLLKL